MPGGREPILERGEVTLRYPEAGDYAQCFAAGRQAKGRNVGVMGGSGGSAVGFSDAADEMGLKLVPLSDKTMAVLRECLPNVASLENPVDYAAGFISDKNMPKYQRALDAVLARFKGSFEQTPPIYSAKNIDGERAYDLARRGNAATLTRPKAVTVTVSRLSVVTFDGDAPALKNGSGLTAFGFGTSR